MKLVIIIMIVLAMAGPAAGGGLDDYRVSLFGVTIHDPGRTEDLSLTKVVAGAAVSFLVHELGHIAIGRLAGYDTWVETGDGLPYIGARRYGPGDPTRESRFWFHAGGFIGQAIGGFVLKKTWPKSDFTFGYNGYAAINSFLYTTTEGAGKTRGTSDVDNLNRINGDGLGIATAGASLFLHTWLLLSK